MSLRILPLFFLSGAASLVYEVCWVRRFGLMFGNTVTSAAVVSAVFMGGLGLGGWLAGRWGDRQPAPLRTYGRVELGVALCGAGLAWLLPALSLTPSFAPGAHGWLFPSDLGLRVLLTVALLAIPCLLMGATLPLLGRHLLVGRTDDAGWRMSLLYGANALGAAAGALAADLWLVPAMGLLATQGVAVGANLVAGGAALALTGPGVSSPAAAPSGAAPAAPWGVAGALVLAGFAAMGTEIAWFRFLGSALGHFRAVFAMLVATLLTGLWAGALLSGWLQRRHGRAAGLLAVGQASVAVSTLLLLGHFDADDVLAAQLRQAPLLANLRSVGFAVFLPAAAMGFAFPMANALVQTDDAGIARRAGLLYAGTTAGNVAGSLVTAFALLPWLGIQRTVLVLAMVAGLAPLLVARRLWPATATVALAGLWFSRLPPDQLLWASFPQDRAQAEGVLDVVEGAEQVIVVTGSAEGPARLWTSGHPMSSTTEHAQRYMRFMAHLPLLMQAAPKGALVICFGVGNTAHAVSLHDSIATLDVADLSPRILEQARHFEHANQGVLQDPRTRVFVDDGRRVLRSQGPYDLVTLEPPPIGYAGVSALYAVELYEQVRDRLTLGGLVTQWVPGYQVDGDAVSSLVAAFVEVFPGAVLFVADRREMVLLGGRGALSFDPAQVQARIGDRPRVAADLASIGLPTAVDLASRFAGTDLAAAVAGVPPVTDDRPLLEYSQRNQVTRTRLPEALFHPEAIARWCPSCDVPQADYRTDTFLEFSNLPL